MPEKFVQSLIVLMAANPWIRADGKASSNLFAAPIIVWPLVTMSSTNTMSATSPRSPCTANDSKCSVGVGLCSAWLVADLRTALVRVRHGSTRSPNCLLTSAVAIRSGAQRLSGCSSELRGSGTRTELVEKSRLKGSSDLRCSIVLEIQSDMGTGGSSTKESFFMDLIIWRDN